MTYEQLPIEGASQIPGFNGVGIIDLEDYNKKELAPPKIKGGVFSHVGVLDLNEVDENDSKWFNVGIREEGNTEERIQTFENKYEVEGFKTTYVPPLMGTDEDPRDGRGRIIAAKRRGERFIPAYYYVITDDSEKSKVTDGLTENLRHDPSFGATMENVIMGCIFLIAKNELEVMQCHEDPSCIGYLTVVSIGILYLVYRFFTRGMSRQGRREALWNFLFRKTKNKN